MQANEANKAIVRHVFIDPRQWVTNYADYLYNYALNRIADMEEARDLVQETFLAGLENMNQFENRSSEKTWLTGILKHKIIDVYRKRSSLKNIPAAEKDQPDFFEAETGHWNEDQVPAVFGIEQPGTVENKEFHGILLKCIQKLPPLWMSVFTMKHMDDEKSDTICSALKVSASNFWVIIHRAKLNLRACLQKNWN